jgi:hypothetical protein
MAFITLTRRGSEGKRFRVNTNHIISYGEKTYGRYVKGQHEVERNIHVEVWLTNVGANIYNTVSVEETMEEMDLLLIPKI